MKRSCPLIASSFTKEPPSYLPKPMNTSEIQLRLGRINSRTIVWQPIPITRFWPRLFRCGEIRSARIICRTGFRATVVFTTDTLNISFKTSRIIEQTIDNVTKRVSHSVSRITHLSSEELWQCVQQCAIVEPSLQKSLSFDITNLNVCSKTGSTFYFVDSTKIKSIPR